MDISNLAGRVAVQVKADLSPLEQGFSDAERKAKDFDQKASNSFNRAGGAARQFANEVRGSAARAAAANDNVRGSAMRIATAYEGATAAATRLASAMGTIAGSLIVAALTKMADSWSDMSARVGLAINDMDGAGAVMDRLGAVARRTYSDLSLTVESFLANNATLKELGKTTAQTLDYVEALNLALVVSGAKAERAASVQDALSKAMALGKLSGDQLNTVIMSGGEVVELLAKELGTSTLKLRELGAEGKITRDIIYSALVKSLDDLRAKAELMPATIADGFTLLRNAILQTVGVFDQANQLSAGFSSGIVAVADNIGTAFEVAGAVALIFAARLAGPVVGSLAATVAAGMRGITMLRIYDVETRKLNVSLTLATAGARAFSGALALVGGPAGAAMLALSGVIYLAASNAQEARERSERYAEAIKKAGDNSGGASGGIREAARALQDVKTAATEAENAVSRALAQADLAASAVQMTAKIQQLGATMGWASVGIQADLRDLQSEFFSGKISAEDFIRKVDDISRLNPDASAIIAAIQDVARTAAAAMGVLDAFNSKVGEVMTTPKTDRLGAPQPLSDGDFNNRWGGQYSKTWKELFPDLFKSDKGGRGSAEKEAEKQAKAYDRITQSAQEFIASQEIERQALGMTEQQANALRYEMDLLNEAKRAGITLSEADKQGFKALAEAMAEAEDRTRVLTERFEFMKDVTKGFFTDFKNDLFNNLQQGMSFWESTWRAMASAAEKAIDKIIDKLLNDLTNAIFQTNQTAGGGGNGLFGFLGSLFGGGGLNIFPGGGSLNSTMGLWANGGAFANGISGFSNTIVDRATPFRFASGAGIMGEAGPEAIMPLRRGPDGRLGVTAANGNERSADNQNISVSFAPNITVQNGGDNAGEQVTEALKKFEKEFTPRVVKSLREAKTRGMI